MIMEIVGVFPYFYFWCLNRLVGQGNYLTIKKNQLCDLKSLPEGNSGKKNSTMGWPSKTVGSHELKKKKEIKK